MTADSRSVHGQVFRLRPGVWYSVVVCWMHGHPLTVVRAWPLWSMAMYATHRHVVAQEAMAGKLAELRRKAS